jgi:hypothetical protein
MISRLRLGGALAALLLAFLGQPAAAQAPRSGSIFTVADVPVDATAASAAAARDQARLDGERRAFRILLERLTLAADRGRLPKVSDAQLPDLVRDFEVANERRSAVRYLADYTFRFRPEAVRSLLQSSSVPFTETMSKPVTVLPVLTRDATTVLWDDPNPWRDAWASRKSPGGLVPIVVPLGDAADIAALDAQKALAADADGIAAITGRYGGGDALIALARPNSNGEIVTSAKRISGGAATDLPGETIRPNGDEKPNQVMARAVEQTVAALEEVWKRETLVATGGQEAVLTATVPLGDLADWVYVRQRLTGLAVVRRNDLIALDKHGATLEIHYLGDPGRLRLALAQRDLVLHQDGDNWTLARRGAAAPAPAPTAPAQ